MHASTAGLNARRRTSARNGSNSGSPGLRHPARDHDHVRVEDVQQVRDASAKEVGGLAHDLARDVVILLRRVVHELRGDLVRSSVHQLVQDRRLAARERLARALRDRRAGRVRLETAVVAALAATSRRVDGRVADLARDVRRAVKEATVENESAADAGTDRYADDVTARLSPRRTTIRQASRSSRRCRATPAARRASRPRPAAGNSSSRGSA